MSNSGRHGEIITDRRLASATFVVSIAGARLVTPRTEAVRWTSTMAHRVVVGLQHVEALRAIPSSKTPGGRKRGNGALLCEPQTVVNYGYAPTPSQLWLCTHTQSINYGCAPKHPVNYGYAPKHPVNYGYGGAQGGSQLSSQPFATPSTLRTVLGNSTSSPLSIFRQVKLRWSAWSRVQRASAERSKFTASEDEELVRCRLHDRLVCAS